MEQRKQALERIIQECISVSLHGQLMPGQLVSFMVTQCLTHCFHEGYFISDQLAAWLKEEGDFSKMELEHVLGIIKTRSAKEAGVLFLMPGEGKSASNSAQSYKETVCYASTEAGKSPNLGENGREDDSGTEWSPDDDEGFYIPVGK